MKTDDIECGIVSLKGAEKKPTAVESLCNAAPVMPQTLVFDRQSQKYKERFFFFCKQIGRINQNKPLQIQS